MPGPQRPTVVELEFSIFLTVSLFLFGFCGLTTYLLDFYFAKFLYMRYGVTVINDLLHAPVKVPRSVTDAVLDESKISTAKVCVAMFTAGVPPLMTVR